MADVERQHPSTMTPDVAVLGGGLAGLATAIHLARRGLDVICLEPRPWPREVVGESLEFSAPRLLTELGLEPHELVARGHGLPKTDVHITSVDGDFSVWPPPWFARPPIRCERETFHVDRVALDHAAMRLAVAEGVRIVPERVATVRAAGSVIEGLDTREGRRIHACWYVDASGHHCRLVGRALELDRVELGPRRIGYWTRVHTPPTGHVTELHLGDPMADELSWCWEIPLSDCEVSVGAVVPAARVVELRRRGLTPRQVFEHEISGSPRLNRLVTQRPGLDIHSTSFVPYRHRRPVGPNWILVGDASAMVDPLTSNGVTSALRHADLAARILTRAHQRGTISRRDGWLYNRTVADTTATVGTAMESFLHRPAIRRRFGLRAAVSLYAATGVIVNSLYARLDPRTLPKAVACAAVAAASRVWVSAAGSVLSIAIRTAGDSSSAVIPVRQPPTAPRG